MTDSRPYGQYPPDSFAPMHDRSIIWLRRVGIAEGISLLVLLFIAMPLKYIWGQPAAVRYVGWAHGLLFISFIVMVLWAYQEKGWPFRMVVLAFVAALLPFGTFVFDKKLKERTNQAL